MSRLIAVLSDTHGLLRPEVLRQIEGTDMILHAGDINRKEILDRLEEIAPVHAVRGNNDKEWAEYLPESLELEIEGRKIFMIHKRKELPVDLSAYDLVIFGHSHKYLEEQKETTFLLNPGSCGKRRFDQEITFAMVRIDENGITVDKILIPQ